MFSNQIIKQKEKQERKAKRSAKRQGLVYQPPQPVSIQTQPPKKNIIQTNAGTNNFGRLINSWALGRNLVKFKQAKDYINSQQSKLPPSYQTVINGDGFEKLLNNLKKD